MHSAPRKRQVSRRQEQHLERPDFSLFSKSTKEFPLRMHHIPHAKAPSKHHVRTSKQIRTLKGNGSPNGDSEGHTEAGKKHLLGRPLRALMQNNSICKTDLETDLTMKSQHNLFEGWK